MRTSTQEKWGRPIVKETMERKKETEIIQHLFLPNYFIFGCLLFVLSIFGWSEPKEASCSSNIKLKRVCTASEVTLWLVVVFFIGFSSLSSSSPYSHFILTFNLSPLMKQTRSFKFKGIKKIEGFWCTVGPNCLVKWVGRHDYEWKMV